MSLAAAVTVGPDHGLAELRDSALVLVAAWLLSALLLRALMPLLERYAMARPNARSSHRKPTAQGGGVAVVAATVAVGLAALVATGSIHDLGTARLAIAAGAIVVLAGVGAADDILTLPVLPRLGLQVLAAAALVTALPAGLRALPAVPAAFETVILVVGLVWFINLTNFMDGIDGITVAEMVPVSLALGVLALLGAVPDWAGLLALALAGALLGFEPANRHVARVFLGDVGSLAIGGLAGYLLIVLAGRGSLAAALLLPLYYLVDATVTLMRRWLNGERLAEAHRQHAYQRATDRGWTVPAVTRQILLVNFALATLAWASVLVRSTAFDMVLLAVGLAAVISLIARLERGPR